MTDFETVTGRGVKGVVNGTTYQVGRPEWIEEQQLYLPNSLQKGLNIADERGESAVVLLDESQAVAVISMADKVRERARETISKLN